jgi:hypothetical protein
VFEHSSSLAELPSVDAPWPQVLAILPAVLLQPSPVHSSIGVNARPVGDAFGMNLVNQRFVTRRPPRRGQELDPEPLDTFQARIDILVHIHTNLAFRHHKSGD